MKAGTAVSAMACAIMLGATSSALATNVFEARLDGAQEVGPTNSDATGSARLILNATKDRVEGDVQLFGVDLDGNQTPDPDDDVVAFHIHRAPVGVNGPVVFGFISPNNDQNGELMINPELGTVWFGWDLNEGNGTTLAAELANLRAGDLYFNVHTVGIGSGEIRGQIVHSSIPEPMTAGLAMCGLTGLGLLSSRRRRVG